MIKLQLGNSYSKITGLSALRERELRELLSYTVGGSSAHFSGLGIRKKSLLSKRGEFPTGLYHRVIKYLGNLTTQIEHISKPKNKRLPVQIDAKAYNWQNAALLYGYQNNRGSIKAPTGTGKSRCMAMFAGSFGVKALWVVPSLEIKKQTILSYGHLSNVTITNIDDPKLDKMVGFDLLILDECHHAAAKRYHKLNKTAWKDIFYRYSFSATTFRNDPEEQLLYEAICGEVIYSLSYKEAVDKGYIVPIESYYIESLKQPTDAFTYQQVYSELVVNNTAKNTAIANLLTSLHSSGKSTLCLVREVAHGELLSELTGLPFVNGADEDSRKYIKRFNEGAIKVLIGTTGVMGEGIDSRPCEFVVIAGSGKAKSQFMQACGRAVRKYQDKTSAKIILIKDKSHRFLTRHFNAQRAILKDEYNSIPVKLEI